MRRTARIVAAVLFLAGTGCGCVAGETPPVPPKPPPPPAPAAPAVIAGTPAWLGFFLGDEPDGGVRVVAVADGGPAAKAGIREGDLVLSVNRQPATDRRKLRELTAGLRAGEKVAVEVLRDGRTETHVVQAEPRVIKLRFGGDLLGPTTSFTVGDAESLLLEGLRRADAGSGATLAAIPGELRRFYGAPEGTGALVTGIAKESPAAVAGLEVGDVVVQAGGAPIREPGDLERLLAARKAGVPLELRIVRGGKASAVSIVKTAAAERRRDREARLAELEAEMAALKARIDEVQREIERIRRAP